MQKNSVEMILKEEHPELLSGGKCLKPIHRYMCKLNRRVYCAHTHTHTHTRTRTHTHTHTHTSCNGPNKRVQQKPNGVVPRSYDQHHPIRLSSDVRLIKLVEESSLYIVGGSPLLDTLQCMSNVCEDEVDF